MEKLSAIIEEFRFAMELLIAQGMFAYAFAKPRKNFKIKFIGGFLLMNLISVFYVPYQKYLEVNQIPGSRYLVLAWYIFLVCLSVGYIFICFKMTLSDTLYICIAGYACQHIEYILINEILCMKLFPQIMDNLMVYILVCGLSTLCFYTIVYQLLVRRLKEYSREVYQDNPTYILYFILLFIILLTSSFMCQDIFRFGANDTYNYLGALAGFFNCTLILVVQYNGFRANSLSREKEIVKQLLNERQKQYEMSKENIELINQKCHDLKHQIHMLSHTNVADFTQYVKEVEDAIQIYDNVINTNNQVLNTILSEKSLYCKKYEIEFTCIVDGEKLDFMNLHDVYALLGNALDNAIECVMNQENKEKRIISLKIEGKDGFLSIQTINYLSQQIVMAEGIPVTSKEDKEHHGFGIKSMKHIVQKYGGSLYTSAESEMFLLQIVIPIS